MPCFWPPKLFATTVAKAARGPRLCPIFFIGAHAFVLDIPILTRDVSRYRTYFPEVRLIST